MRSSALYFAVLWVSISAVIFGFSTSTYMANTDTLGKEGLFMVFISLLFMLTGIFFTINYQKIKLYLENYKSEKQI